MPYSLLSKLVENNFYLDHTNDYIPLAVIAASELALSDNDKCAGFAPFAFALSILYTVTLGFILLHAWKKRGTDKSFVEHAFIPFLILNNITRIIFFVSWGVKHADECPTMIITEENYNWTAYLSNIPAHFYVTAFSIVVYKFSHVYHRVVRTSPKDKLLSSIVILFLIVANVFSYGSALATYVQITWFIDTRDEKNLSWIQNIELNGLIVVSSLMAASLFIYGVALYLHFRSLIKIREFNAQVDGIRCENYNDDEHNFIRAQNFGAQGYDNNNTDQLIHLGNGSNGYIPPNAYNNDINNNMGQTVGVDQEIGYTHYPNNHADHQNQHRHPSSTQTNSQFTGDITLSQHSNGSGASSKRHGSSKLGTNSSQLESLSQSQNSSSLLRTNADPSDGNVHNGTLKNGQITLGVGQDGTFAPTFPTQAPIHTTHQHNKHNTLQIRAGNLNNHGEQKIGSIAANNNTNHRNKNNPPHRLNTLNSPLSSMASPSGRTSLLSHGSGHGSDTNTSGQDQFQRFFQSQLDMSKNNQQRHSGDHGGSSQGDDAFTTSFDSAIDQSRYSANFTDTSSTHNIPKTTHFLQQNINNSNNNNNNNNNNISPQSTNDFYQTHRNPNANSPSSRIKQYGGASAFGSNNKGRAQSRASKSRDPFSQHSNIQLQNNTLSHNNNNNNTNCSTIVLSNDTDYTMFNDYTDRSQDGYGFNAGSNTQQHQDKQQQYLLANVHNNGFGQSDDYNQHNTDYLEGSPSTHHLATTNGTAQYTLHDGHNLLSQSVPLEREKQKNHMISPFLVSLCSAFCFAIRVALLILMSNDKLQQGPEVILFYSCCSEIIPLNLLWIVFYNPSLTRPAQQPHVLTPNTANDGFDFHGLVDNNGHSAMMNVDDYSYYDHGHNDDYDNDNHHPHNPNRPVFFQQMDQQSLIDSQDGSIIVDNEPSGLGLGANDYAGSIQAQESHLPM